MRRSMLASTVTILAILATTATRADAGKNDDDDDDDDARPGIVLVNTVQTVGGGQIDKLRKVLDARGLLHRLPSRLEAALDGRALRVGDLDAIKEAYANEDYQRALELLEEDEARVLRSAAAGDPLPALANLAEWRGLIEARRDNEAEAIQWFRAAHRFNPARQIDKRLASPSVRVMMKRARTDEGAPGRIRIDAEPDDAMVQVDGGRPQPAGKKITLAAGYHLVTVMAKGRKDYSEIVDIEAGKLEKFSIALDPETSGDKAAKLVDATVTAAPGKPRLKRASALARITGTKLFLMIEDTGDDRVTVRVYDVSTKKVSMPVDLLDAASSRTIMRKVNAALDPDSMIDATRVTVIQTERKQRWYERWYVWVGVGAVVGGGALGYRYMTREPTAVRF